MSLSYTRAIIDAIHSGELEKVECSEEPVFKFHVPTTCPNVPANILNPELVWKDKAKFTETRKKLANLFEKNFETYKSGCSEAIINAGPKVG